MKTKQIAKTSLAVFALAGFLVIQSAQAQPTAHGPGSAAQALPSSAKTPASDDGTTTTPDPGATVPAVAEEIRDIRGPYAIPDPWWWVIYAAASAAGLLVLWLVWRAFGRRKQPPRLAHEKAFDALERARALIQPRQGREFAFAVSDAIRSYIEERFSLHATHQTTSEFLHHIVSGDQTALAQHKQLLRDFLKNCDLGKFARWGLAVDEMEAMFQSAWAFVDQTKPNEQTQPATKEKPSKIRGAERREGAPPRDLAVGGVS